MSHSATTKFVLAQIQNTELKYNVIFAGNGAFPYITTFDKLSR